MDVQPPRFLPLGFEVASANGRTVSVITATLNSATTLPRTLESVASQTCDGLEHIIVDGESTDATLELAHGATHDRVVHSGPDTGIYDAFNKGLGLSSGELVVFLGGDDVFAHEGVVRRILEEARQHPEVDVFHADLDLVDASGAVVREDRFYPKYPIDSEQNRENYAGTWLRQVFYPTAFIRRRVFGRIGGFDPSYRIAGDIEHLLRAYRAGSRFRYVPGVVVRMGCDGVSNRSAWSAEIEALRAFRAHSTSPLRPFVQFARTQLVGVLTRRAPRALKLARWALGSPRESGYGPSLRAQARQP